MITPPELGPRVNKKKKPYNPTESVPLKVTGGVNSIERAITDGSSSGRYNLVATNEVLVDGEFQAVAEITQDATTNGFVDLSPEDTVDIVIAMTEGVAPVASEVPAYDEKKVRSIQQQSAEIQKAISTINLEGIASLKLQLEAQKPNILSRDVQTLLKYIDSVIVQCSVLCMGGNTNQPNNPRWFLTKKALTEYMVLLHHEVNH